jgi:hypothetical protein
VALALGLIPEGFNNCNGFTINTIDGRIVSENQYLCWSSHTFPSLDVETARPGSKIPESIGMANIKDVRETLRWK